MRVVRPLTPYRTNLRQFPARVPVKASVASRKIPSPADLSARLATAIPEQIRTIVTRLHHAGYKVYIVGGAVRNTALGLAVTDWDISTTARPAQVQQIFADTPQTEFGFRHGFIQLVLRDQANKKPIDIYTLRSRRLGHSTTPFEWEFTDDIVRDLGCRDITINAIAWEPVTGRIFDPHGGLRNLEHSWVRAVGSPARTIAQDPIHAFRAVRFTAALGFTLDPNFISEMAISPAINLTPRWYMAEEFLKMLALPHCDRALQLLKKTGLMRIVFPEVDWSSDLPLLIAHRDINLFKYIVGVTDACVPQARRFTPRETALMRLAMLVWYADQVRLEVKFRGFKRSPLRTFNAMLDSFHLSNDERWKVDKMASQYGELNDEVLHSGSFEKLIVPIGQCPHEVLEMIYARQRFFNQGDLTRALVDQMHDGLTLHHRKFPIPISDQDICTLFARKHGPWLRDAVDLVRHVVIGSPDFEHRDTVIAYFTEHREKFWTVIECMGAYYGRKRQEREISTAQMEQYLTRRDPVVTLKILERDEAHSEPPPLSPELEALRLRLNASIGELPDFTRLRELTVRTRRYFIRVPFKGDTIPIPIVSGRDPDEIDD